eukprot:CAMPEP_0173381072 /NCGR_PEP_ID=MMETSP1356-20130122/3565_1 /TAXON_ID=77927 ORGANISM="Hemiselmis virescens, Strain PCC157" /NCGR_SAMPLE_ID=MMETSP1356 /ASSEMBLY_ACC=CAM_ASM_000847 /LENGTH=220 /DNA_ID=CAMNT_0014334815 /DNA_START=29 /DNA_END=688 /DNA_ORIENTATION=+
MATPEKLSAEAIDAMGKKELLEALHAIAPLAFLQDKKLAGNVANVAKKAKKEDVQKAYEDLFQAGTFASKDQIEAEALADSMKKAAIADEKKAAAEAAAAAAAAASGPVDDGPKRFTKIVNKNGNKLNFPMKGDRVKVFYTGKLEDDTIFDSNCDVEWCKTNKRKPQPLVFKVGSGQVIRGWDEAILEMSVGEHATINIESEWAYGKKGQPAAGIPKDAN